MGVPHALPSLWSGGAFISNDILRRQSMGCLSSPLNRGSKDIGDLLSVALLVRGGDPAWVAQSSGWGVRTMIFCGDY